MAKGDKLVGNWVDGRGDDILRHFLPNGHDFTACGIPFLENGEALPPGSKEHQPCPTCIAFSPAVSAE